MHIPHQWWSSPSWHVFSILIRPTAPLWQTRLKIICTTTQIPHCCILSRCANRSLRLFSCTILLFYSLQHEQGASIRKPANRGANSSWPHQTASIKNTTPAKAGGRCCAGPKIPLQQHLLSGSSERQHFSCWPSHDIPVRFVWSHFKKSQIKPGRGENEERRKKRRRGRIACLCCCVCRGVAEG